MPPDPHDLNPSSIPKDKREGGPRGREAPEGETDLISSSPPTANGLLVMGRSSISSLFRDSMDLLATAAILPPPRPRAVVEAPVLLVPPPPLLAFF